MQVHVLQRPWAYLVCLSTTWLVACSALRGGGEGPSEPQSAGAGTGNGPAAGQVLEAGFSAEGGLRVQDLTGKWSDGTQRLELFSDGRYLWSAIAAAEPDTKLRQPIPARGAWRPHQPLAELGAATEQRFGAVLIGPDADRGSGGIVMPLVLDGGRYGLLADPDMGLLWRRE